MSEASDHDRLSTDDGEAVPIFVVMLRVPDRDLFRSKEELIAEVLVRQEERVAYVDEKLVADAAREAS